MSQLHENGLGQIVCPAYEVFAMLLSVALTCCIAHPLTASSQPQRCHCKQGNMQHCIATHRSRILQWAFTCCRPLKAAGPSREQPRCLGAGLAVALHLLQQANPSTLPALPDLDGLPTPTSRKPGRILLIITGPATKVK